jgi:ABC-type uncharacterized transport system permease subunit
LLQKFRIAAMMKKDKANVRAVAMFIFNIVQKYYFNKTYVFFGIYYHASTEDPDASGASVSPVSLVRPSIRTSSSYYRF